MKLIKDKKFLQNIAHYIDLTNTIGGGISQPTIRMEKRKSGALLRVQMPGIEPEQWQVVVDKNNLAVMALHQNPENPAKQIPLFHQNFVLPLHANLAQLEASFVGRELRVNIPFLPKGPRELEINNLD